ncbi:MAG: hypothetical protein M5U09_07875 [Gammaproteobacteria bacterium]|nr:hypothetical protein [Gammaproteobacteria bacterium]
MAVGSDYTRGVMLVLAGGFFLSMAGIMLRHVESADGWQILFYRSISFFVTLSLILALRYRTRTPAAFRAVGVRGMVGAASLGIGSVCYIFAILHTTVANVVFIIGATPPGHRAGGVVLAARACFRDQPGRHAGGPRRHRPDAGRRVG